MTRYYVNMTWDDWPEGGSYSDIIEAEDHDEAEAACRSLMAQSRFHREDFGEEDTLDTMTAKMLEKYGHKWHEADCFDIDEFIANYSTAPPALDAREKATVLAALRFWQATMEGTASQMPDTEQCQAIHEIATNCGAIDVLDISEIDALCERINCADRPTITIFMDGGLVEGYEATIPLDVKVHDYDIEGIVEREILTDKDGKEFIVIEL